MFRKLTLIAFVMIGVLAGQQIGAAATNGSAEEAKAMVEKAVKLLSSEGSEKAYAAFDDPAGGFVDRDLYVFVLDLQGTIVAHGANKALIGKSIVNLKDTAGKAFIQEMIELGKASGEGWIDYNWPNPVTKKIEGKSSFIKKVGDVLVGVGIYKG